MCDRACVRGHGVPHDLCEWSGTGASALERLGRHSLHTHDTA